ncbi:fungal-specific transcription factor domain-containing protein [Xylariales sp. PMI_506]|nr:fungal-specific transcription factor domain-containing protein [Xylariales sp. PMI_506]
MEPAPDPLPPPPTERNGRKYRSKKQRPCDLCRSRKIHCKIQESEAGCELCKKLDRRCTFVLEPLKRTGLSRANTDRPNQSLVTQPLASDSPGMQSTQHRRTVPGDHDPNHAMDTESFWAPQAEHGQGFSPSDAVPLLPMEWEPMDFPIGSSLRPGGGTMPVAPSQLTLTGYPMRQDSNYLSTGPSVPQAELGEDCMPTSMHRADDLLRPTSERIAPGISSGSSSSVADMVNSPSSGSGPLTMDLGLNVSDQQHLAEDRAHGERGLSSDLRLDWPAEFALDSRKGYSNQLIGLSCETDPYVIRHYQYNMHDTYTMFRLDFRKVTDDAKIQAFDQDILTGPLLPPAGHPPIRFVMTHEDIWKDSIKTVEGVLSGNSTEKEDLALLNKLVPARLGVRLLKLYTQFVHPRIPVLSLSDLANMPYSECGPLNPIGLQSAAYALAAPFTFLDDELSVSRGYGQIATEELWAIANRSFQRASCLSHLSALQLCLLLLQMPPPNFAVAEPLSTWSLSCSALAIAESLGLNLDPSDWRLPRKEVMLRRRLWWLTYIQHIWEAIVIGRPSHLNDANWDVSKLTTADFEGDELSDPELRDTVIRQIPICLAQCELSIIAADILKEFYTLKAVRESASLGALLNRAQPLRARIESWRQTLPFLAKPAAELDEEELEEGGCLRLSHLTLETLIFRALLRPLVIQAVPAAERSREPVSTIFENCFTCAKVGTEMVSALRARHFATFWPPYVRYHMCYISSFILMNFTQSLTRETAVRNKDLLSKWRNILRTQSRVWPLARLATIRLDAAFWRGLPLIVHGAGPESPAFQLIQEQYPSPSGEG